MLLSGLASALGATEACIAASFKAYVTLIPWRLLPLPILDQSKRLAMVRGHGSGVGEQDAPDMILCFTCSASPTAFCTHHPEALEDFIETCWLCTGA